MSATSEAPEGSQPPRGRRAVFALISLGLGMLAAGALAEIGFRVLEAVRAREWSREGPGAHWELDPRWGWKLTQGWYRTRGPEFETHGFVNSLHMNGPAYDPEAGREATRLMVLGDSHTAATGVSMDENWAAVLERKLNAGGDGPFVAYNAAVPGFSLQQYLLRLIDQGPLLAPHYVLVGLSYATDLYDLIPPDRSQDYTPTQRQWQMDYFDFDESGALVELHWDSGKAVEVERAGGHSVEWLRSILRELATYRFLRRSELAFFIGSRVKLGGQSLWPNMEVVVQREISPEFRYNWRLLEALLLRIQSESQALGAELIVVGIPYLPQVYDEVWQQSFGDRERYDRTAANERIRAWCQAHRIPYLDALESLRTRSRELGRWLHYPRDAHPTPEGHEVIARMVLDSGRIGAPGNQAAGP